MAQAKKTAIKGKVLGHISGFKNRYQNLNPEQKKAVDATEGVVMVLAGPGTGKTELLAMRAANIVRQTQINPSNILCLTFTESGVAAMRERLSQIMGPAGYQVAVHTFHSFCNRVIQENPELFSFNKELSAITEAEQIKVLETLIKKLPATSSLKPFGNPVLYLKDIANSIRQLKQENISPKKLETITQKTNDLLKEIAEPLDNFCSLKPKERTESTTEDLANALAELKPSFKELKFHFEWLEKTFTDWQGATKLAEGERGASALRTKLKNDLSRWHKKLISQTPKQLQLVDIYRQYQKSLKEKGWYDFEDMIINAVLEFSRNSDLLADYQEQFQYFLIDEYQDTNGAQNDLIFTLCQQHDTPNLFVVGDDKQAIYRFQGASLENLLQLHEKFASAIVTVALSANYRSQQNILDAAQELISFNSASLPETNVQLISQGNLPKKPIQQQVFLDQATEYYGLSGQIKELISNGAKASEIAVLFRKNADAKRFAQEFKRHGIAVSLELDEDILDTAIIAQFVMVLKFFAQPTNVKLARIINFNWLFNDSLSALKIQVAAAKNKQPLLETVEQMKPEWATKLAKLQQEAQSKLLPDFISELLEKTNFINYFVVEEEQHDLLARVKALFTESKRLVSSNPGFSLANFITHLDFLDEHDLTITNNTVGSSEAVRIMTAHKAKGLEFSHVYIPHAVDKTWGNMRGRSGLTLPHGLLAHEKITTDDNEDERRLFYVALTRAKEELVISYAKTNEDKKSYIASSFVNELPQKLLEEKQIELDAKKLKEKNTAELMPVKVDTKTSNYVKNLLQGYIMSVTHLNNYLKCPRLFYYSNVLHIPAIKTKHMALGTAIHAALNDVFASQEENLLKRFEYHLKRELLSKQDLKDSLEFGKEALKKYWQHYQPSQQTNVLTEYNFKHHGVTVGSAKLTGMLDKVEILDDVTKEVNVVDYKTGQPDNKRVALKEGGEYFRQLVFYKLLCDNASDFKYKFVSGEIDFIQTSRQGKFVKKKFSITDEHTDKLKEEIDNTWSSIQNLDFLEAPGCGECEHCMVGT